MSDYTPQNKRWRSTPAVSTFLKIPVIPFMLTVFVVLFVQKLAVLFVCAIMIIFAVYLNARNKRLKHVLKRMHYRFTTFNFRQSRIY